MTCTCPVPYGRTSDHRKWPHLSRCPESHTIQRTKRKEVKRDNPRWHEPDRIVVADPEAVAQHLQAARDSLALAMKPLDVEDDLNEAQEDVYSAVAWIDHAAHMVKGVMLYADGHGELRDPDEIDWTIGYVEVPAD